MNTDDVDKILKKYQKQTEQYLGSLKEDFDHKLDAVLEYVSDVPEMKTKIDLTFEKVGEFTEKVEVATDVLKDHEQRIRKIEVR